MSSITMYDTIYNDQFPSGAQAYAAYVDGSVGDQPNYAYIVKAFPKAQHLSISLSGSVNADVLDVEEYAAVPGDVPGWYSRQKQRGIQRPCVYANVSTMQASILPVLSQAKIGRPDVRLWTAHYDAGEHICGPDSCGYLSTRGRRHAMDLERAGPGPRSVRTAGQLLHDRSDRHHGGGIAVRPAQPRQ